MKKSLLLLAAVALCAPLFCSAGPTDVSDPGVTAQVVQVEIAPAALIAPDMIRVEPASVAIHAAFPVAHAAPIEAARHAVCSHDSPPGGASAPSLTMTAYQSMSAPPHPSGISPCANAPVADKHADTDRELWST